MVKTAYPEWFNELWINYPKRSGGNNKRAAYKAAQARIKEGYNHEELLKGTIEYRTYLEKTKRIGTCYVKMAQTFYGPNCHFEDEWTHESHQPDQPQSRAAANESIFRDYAIAVNARAGCGDAAGMAKAAKYIW